MRTLRRLFVLALLAVLAFTVLASHRHEKAACEGTGGHLVHTRQSGGYECWHGPIPW